MIKGNLVNLRFPEPADHRSLVKWRNENLQHFFSDELVSMENHLDWYERVSHDASQRFFVIEHGSEQVADQGRIAHFPGDPNFPRVPCFPQEFSELIGTIGLANIDFRHRRAEYGRFLIAEEYRGKGYGKDALLTLLEFAFNTLGLYKVYGDILTTNEAAIQIDESLGFQQEGIFRDHVWKSGKFFNVVRMSISLPCSTTYGGGVTNYSTPSGGTDK